MRIWSFVQQKGGVGKSTICLNLSVVAEANCERVLVVDLDPQATALFWSSTRGTNKPPVIDALPEKLEDIIRAAPDLGVTLIMIDVPSRLDAIALTAIRAADMIVCPTLPDLLNLKPLKDTVSLLEAAGKLGASIGVINNVDESGAATNIAHAKAVLESFGIQICSTVIYHLPQFAAAYNEGKGVTEYKRGTKAAKQVRDLWVHLNEQAKEIEAGKVNGKEAWA